MSCKDIDKLIEYFDQLNAARLASLESQMRDDIAWVYGSILAVIIAQVICVSLLIAFYPSWSLLIALNQGKLKTQ